MSELLPLELWTEILARLPVRTLLSLKCVSNYFLSLIQNPNFAHLHFSRFNNRNPNDSGLLIFDRVSKLEMDACRVNDLTKTLEFKIPSNIYEYVAGYVNGFLLLFRFNCRDMILCNPSIKKSITIPFPPSVEEPEWVGAGFGYDPVSNDYKAVVYRPTGARIGFVEVYSFQLGCWRNIQVDRIPDMMYSKRNIYANGAIHWCQLGRSCGVSNILSFNLGSEVYSYKQLPEKGEDHPFEVNLTYPVLFRGSFAVLYVAVSHICFWVLTENGWDKKCTMQSSSKFFNYLSKPPCFCFNAIFREDTGELIFAKYKVGLILYNIKTQEYKISHEHAIRVYMYEENLLWSELLPSTGHSIPP